MSSKMINYRNTIYNKHPIPLEKLKTEVIEIIADKVADRKMGDDVSYIHVNLFTILHSPLLHV